MTQAVPVRRSLTYLPLLLGIGYVIATHLLYQFGPVPWPSRGKADVPALLATYWLAVGLGYYFGAHARLRARHPIRAWNPEYIIRAAAIAGCLQLPLALMAEFDQPLSDVGFGLGQQAQIYSSRVEIVESGSVLLLLVRVAIAPVILGGLILGVRCFRVLSRPDRWAVAALVASHVALSLARGTDKELFDLFVILLATSVLSSSTPGRSIRRLFSLVGIAVLLVGLFAARRADRLGAGEAFCVDRLNVCVSKDSDTAWAALDERSLFLTTGLTVYLSQGYHGLSLAQDATLPPVSAMGSSVAARNLSTVIGGQAARTSYQAQLSEMGWPEGSAWSTLYTDLANDLTFPGVTVAMLGLGYIWALSYRRARGGDAAGTVVFTLACVMVAYSPANNQLGISLPSLVSATWWLGLFVFGSRRIMPFVVPITAEAAPISTLNASHLWKALDRLRNA